MYLGVGSTDSSSFISKGFIKSSGSMFWKGRGGACGDCTGVTCREGTGVTFWEWAGVTFCEWAGGTCWEGSGVTCWEVEEWGERMGWEEEGGICLASVGESRISSSIVSRPFLLRYQDSFSRILKQMHNLIFSYKKSFIRN